MLSVSVRLGAFFLIYEWALAAIKGARMLLSSFKRDTTSKLRVLAPPRPPLPRPRFDLFMHHVYHKGVHVL